MDPLVSALNGVILEFISALVLLKEVQTEIKCKA